MASPCPCDRARHVAPRSRPAAARFARLFCRRFVQLMALLATLLGSLSIIPATPAQAKPKIWLPTPAGQKWKIIQGYNCGTHSGVEDHFALDLVNTEGKTLGAPVRAAAAGKVYVWESRSGTLILSHGGDFYTQYTHLKSAVSTRLGTSFKRGQVIGAAGDRAASGTPHLHFAAFMGGGRRGRHSIPLAFADGYDLPEMSGCSQHQGQTLAASAGTADEGEDSARADDGGSARADDQPKTLAFHTDAEPDHWYSGDVTIAFDGAAAARGFSVAWDSDPGGDAPQRQAMSTGSARLAEAGEGLHTLYVRAWDADGKQTLATYGPVGYDQTAPRAAKEIVTQTIQTGQSATVRWAAAKDKASGVAGYRVYLGTDADGSSDWYSATPAVQTTSLPTGALVLRVQPIDYAGNAGKWATVGQVTVE